MLSSIWLGCTTPEKAWLKTLPRLSDGLLKLPNKEEHNSQVNLSTFYAQGIGVSENKTESLAWMIVAALAGNETAIKYAPS